MMFELEAKADLAAWQRTPNRISSHMEQALSPSQVANLRCMGSALVPTARSQTGGADASKCGGH